MFVYSTVKFAFLCCVTDWKNHGSEYYECSRYKENPNIANESVHAQAREALKKYLFYFERVYTCFTLLLLWKIYIPIILNTVLFRFIFKIICKLIFSGKIMPKVWSLKNRP